MGRGSAGAAYGTVTRRRRPRPLGRARRGRPRRTLGRATAGILRGGCPCSCSSRGISTVSPGIRDWSVAPSVLHRHGKRVCGPIGGPCCCDRPRRASDSASSGLSLADRDPKAWPGAPAQPVPLARSRDARRCGRSRPLLARPERQASRYREPGGSVRRARVPLLSLAVCSVAVGSVISGRP